MKSEPAIRRGARGFSSRLLTLHNTILYVDPASGLLQHGPRGRSPLNLKLAVDDDGCQLLYQGYDVVQPVGLREGRLVAITDGDADSPLCPPLVFEPIGLRDGRIALRSGGFFVGAEGIGSRNVALSAVHCSTWEHFCLWDAPRPRHWPKEVVGGGRPTPSLSISCLFSYLDDRDPRPAVQAIEATMQCISIDCVYWFSNRSFPKSVAGIEVIHVAIPPIEQYPDDINRVYLDLMPRTVTTDFNLVIQPDGFAVNPQAWDDRFWEYDYVGAAWPFLWGGGPYWGLPIVGNGGFSLRSRKLYDALRDLRPSSRLEDWANSSVYTVPQFSWPVYGRQVLSEDFIICIGYRETLEHRYGINFCPAELANKFSVETVCDFTQYWLGRSFGFHRAEPARYFGVELQQT